jgi:hypothetical protein
MGRNVPKETRLMKKTTRLVREGELVAEVAVELRDDAGAWGPVLSTGDAARLDTVRLALRSGDLRRASELAVHVYRLTPLALNDAR